MRLSLHDTNECKQLKVCVGGIPEKPNASAWLKKIYIYLVCSCRIR